MIFKTWLDTAAAKISTAHDIKPNAGYQEAHYLANAVLGDVVTSDTALSDISIYCLNIALEKRIAHMPLSKIIGKKSFYNNVFITNEHTLDPRPETESIVDLVAIKARTILDLGTGTGCLIITLVQQLAKSIGVAIDISPQALLIAQENAMIMGVDKKIEFKQGNWANDISGHFDLIVTNPPYVDARREYGQELKYDPALALFGDMETYHALFESLKDISFIQLLVETPQWLVLDVVSIANEKYGNEYDIIQHKIGESEISIVEIVKKDIDEKIRK